MERVDYHSLDTAKNRFIEASRRTLGFARDFGFVPSSKLGASANLFELDLSPFLDKNQGSIAIGLVPEGLGTADDARPADLSSSELRQFWYNIAHKTLACMTNDAASAGLQPILVALYLPSSSPESVFTPEFMDGFLSGFVDACREVGCVYIAGETPQLKSKIYPDKLDLAGAVFGLSPAGQDRIDSRRLAAGDQFVWVASSGPHENGFTTLRRMASELPRGYRTRLSDGSEFWQAINQATFLYSPLIQDCLKNNILLSNVEMISGHGWQKLMRPAQDLIYRVHTLPPVPEVFRFVQDHFDISPLDMLTTFNYGAGMAIFVRDDKAANQVIRLAEKRGLPACLGGEVLAGERRRVEVDPLGVCIEGEGFVLEK